MIQRGGGRSVISLIATLATLGCAEGSGATISQGAGGAPNSSAAGGSVASSSAAGGASGSTTSATSSTASSTSGSSSSASSSSGSSSSASSSSSSSSGTGGGSTCAETPCKLTAPQCGCASGQMCTLSGSTRVCTPSGTVSPGGVCSATAACAAGAFCDYITPLGGMCEAFCTDDTACVAPGGLCILTLQDGSGNPIAGVTLCSDNCDPTTNSGCVLGAGCRVYQESSGQMRFFTLCSAAGTGTEQAPCTTPADCAPTYGCFSDGTTSRCLKYCNVASPACPLGTTCAATPIMLGSDAYGACI